MKKYESNFPLSSLSDECTRHFGLEYTENAAHEAGNFFAVATVFPSCKVWMQIFVLSSFFSAVQFLLLNLKNKGINLDIKY